MFLLIAEASISNQVSYLLKKPIERGVPYNYQITCKSISSET